jgi:hypothetical protein
MWWGEFWAAVHDSLAAFPTTLNRLWTPQQLLTILGFPALLRLALGIVGAFLVVQAFQAYIAVRQQQAALSHFSTQLRARRVIIAGLLVGGAILLGICACWPLPRMTLDPGTSTRTIALGLRDAGAIAAAHTVGDAHRLASTARTVSDAVATFRPAPQTGYPGQLGFVAVLLIIAAGAFELFRQLVPTFLTNFFGDVEIYCTHDENSDFFSLRNAILDMVSRTLVQTIQADYDRVYLFAHSLGATIALDALMNTYNLRSEHGLDAEAWQRLRGFVTFGSALEKTRFFLDVYAQSLSQKLEEWRGGYYGVMFTPDESVLTEPNETARGIYWANYWYFLDFISDRIASYRSYLKPTDSLSWSSNIHDEIGAELQGRGTQMFAQPKIVAQNRVSYRLPGTPWSILHGDYLSANWFWDGNSESKTSLVGWWARLLHMNDPTPSDEAIGALAIVCSTTASEPAPPLVPHLIAAPLGPTARHIVPTATGLVSVTDRFDDLDPTEVRSSNLADVVPPR